MHENSTQYLYSSVVSVVLTADQHYRLNFISVLEDRDRPRTNESLLKGDGADFGVFATFGRSLWQYVSSLKDVFLCCFPYRW